MDFDLATEFKRSNLILFEPDSGIEGKLNGLNLYLFFEADIFNYIFFIIIDMNIYSIRYILFNLFKNNFLVNVIYQFQSV